MSLARALWVAGMTTLLLVAFILPTSAGSTIARETAFGPVAAKAAANRRFAERDAAQRLERLRLPPSAIASETLPSGTETLLGEPLGKPLGGRFVSSHRFWEVPGSPRRALYWLRRHPPRGAVLGIEFLGSGPDGIEFAWPHSQPPLLGSSVLVAVAPRSTGGAAIRADVYDGWVLPRDSGQRVPLRARFLSLEISNDDVEVGVPREKLQKGFASASDARFVRAVAQRINNLRAYQVTFLPSCGPPALEPHLIQLTFKTAPHGTTLARVTQEVPIGPCDAMRLKLPGKKRYSLEWGSSVIHKVRGLIRRARK